MFIDPSFLTGLASNHTVIVFDQRGIANTTVGSKPYTYPQLAANTPNFASMFLRVPGTINTKTKYSASNEIVRIEHKWDPNNNLGIPMFADLHSSTDLMYEFMGYMDDKVLEYKIKLDILSKQNSRSQRQNQIHKQKTEWIETLWNTPVADCRKRIIRLILPQYATKIKNMDYADAFNWIKDWAIRCNRERQLDFNIDGNRLLSTVRYGKGS